MTHFSLNNHEFSAIISACKQVLDSDGVLLVPTETVYGLVCKWDSEIGRKKIYELKLRDANKLLAMFAQDKLAAQAFGALLTPEAEVLFERFTPGAITIITPDNLGKTVGIRVPNHQFLLELLGALDYPLASTSANLSGTPPALSVEMGLQSLNGSPDLVVNGGALPQDSLASTVVDATSSEVKILRVGGISEEDIHASLKDC